MITVSIRPKPLLISMAVPVAGGFLSNKLSGDVHAAYESLRLPAFAPQAKWFGILWPVLYLLIGVAAYLVWQLPESEDRTQALVFYGVQLLLSFLWNPLFFRFGQPGPAFGLLCAVFVLATVTAVCFFLLRNRTVWLMFPYLLWLLYTTALNKAVIVLN